MSAPTGWEPRPDFTAKCPRCGVVGSIDEDQATGQVSLICPECGWHGYIDGATADRRGRRIEESEDRQ